MTAVGKGYVAILASDQRGPIECRPATSWGQAFLKAKLLLDAAEKRDWWKGERVSISISQSEE
jgi:hypothetical protein